MKLALRDLLMVVAAIGAILGAHLAFWSTTTPNHPLLVGWYLMAAVVVSVLALRGNVALRNSFQATAIFAWAYFIFVLKAGWFLETIHDSMWLTKYTQVGLALCGVCLLVSYAATALARSGKPAEAQGKPDGEVQRK